ncbi:MAG TPA: acetolactate synthase small subunit [Bacteroidales bacterium]|jgi:acetolactate synthase-1/3 small subunit|nr:MAG: Acetolactate synthase isozyme 1 small subunit [Bacteroidetes bacterium ADurb.Bin416]HBL73274.1 acetolactate synthase small subunit [Bacteroidales bacterium]
MYAILELLVNNHPGVMSHITGLFARRGYNLEGILCGPVGNGDQSIMYLLMLDDHRHEQVVRQLEKLHDVLKVAERPDMDTAVFFSLQMQAIGQ